LGLRTAESAAAAPPQLYKQGTEMHALASLAMKAAAIGAILWSAAAPAQAQTPPPRPSCKEDPLFRAQDYTLGTWDVYNADKIIAEVKMELVLNDCTIFETWNVPKDRPTGNGLGMFAYSRAEKIWNYFWNSDNGATSVLKGTVIKDGEIRYVNENDLPDGKKRLRHWSLILMPDGKVRELSVITDDGGTTWKTEYDLYWHKKG